VGRPSIAGVTASPPAAPSPLTVTEAIESLRSLGYTADYELVDGFLRTDGGNSPCAVDQAVVEHLFRFEGPSDPGDEMIVFGVRDPASGTRGTLAAPFGPSADPGLYEHLSDLRARFG
jgi:hypothetical protein